MNENFDIIHNNIEKYKALNEKLSEDKWLLNRCREDAQILRKENLSINREEYNQKIQKLNAKVDELKHDISVLKKKIKMLFLQSEEMIFSGINEKYTEVYDKLLSRLYGYPVEIIYKKTGENFDENTCKYKTAIITHNKLLNAKVLKTFSFGIRNVEENKTIKYAVVEISLYNKKLMVGDIVENPEL